MSDQLVARLMRELERFEHTPATETVGTVVSVGDGVALIEGLPQAVMAEMVEFETSHGVEVETSLKEKGALYGVILNLEQSQVKAVVLGDTRRVREGMTVRARGTVLSVPVGESLIGRVVSTLGEAKDGGPEIVAKAHYPVERQSYGVIERESVNQPLHTGIKAIDAMVPIGRGQRELIIGDRHTGKTTIAIDTILNQRDEPAETRPICVYVAIGQKESKVARTVALLKERGAMEYTIVVSASASEPAALQFLAPYAGVSMAEYFMEKGKDVLIIYDDLSKQAVAYREIALLLRRPPGREAFPGDIFYLHSRLLERAAKLSKEKGGGSITALPIIETQEGDVSAYIPTNVISITDGQIYLETDLFNKGVRPAINVGLSVSRVGSSAQTKAMKKVAGRMRLELAQFRELEAFAQFASDLDEETKRRIDKGARLVEVLKQGQGMPLSFERQVAVIFAANSGLFDKVEVVRTREVAESLLEFLEVQYGTLLKEIRTSRELAEASETGLATAFEMFISSHPMFFGV